ncbi:16S rRNA (guanine(966)-N(2))-methyltransferase RsmD [Comamonas composti]|uniref:16S rRNA (guanine(966)-N(2))-methyltransferase RsmD n=1 Tax=Comamonas composti TaxID=408558 RepID=UPI0003F6AF20|nr:16S rRNA (guanine(966)-N(2))-methyltransferase RsmD [Comamonas composti]
MSRNSIKLHTPAGRRWLEKAVTQAGEDGKAAAPQPGKNAKAGAKPAMGAGEIRIIGGQWRRTRLPVAQRPGLRPTPDRVRETLFNWLGQDLTGWHCLDAFAGTGALGLEAASRGAASVLMNEQDAALVQQVLGLCERLKAANVRVLRGEAINCLRQAVPGSLDLVFIDPPFDALDLFIPALKAAAQAVKPGGFVYLEAPRAWEAGELESLGGLELYRHLKAGAVHAHLLQRPEAG